MKWQKASPVLLKICCDRNLYNIKLVFGTWDNTQRIPRRVKYWYLIKYVFKIEFNLKIMKFVANFDKSVPEA